jgi:hypothetical protein
MRGVQDEVVPPHLHRLRPELIEFTNFTLGTFIASALALRRRSTLASSGTSKGSVVNGDFQEALG